MKFLKFIMTFWIAGLLLTSIFSCVPNLESVSMSQTELEQTLKTLKEVFIYLSESDKNYDPTLTSIDINNKEINDIISRNGFKTNPQDFITFSAKIFTYQAMKHKDLINKKEASTSVTINSEEVNLEEIVTKVQKSVLSEQDIVLLKENDSKIIDIFSIGK